MCSTKHTRLDLPCFHFDPHGLQGTSPIPGVISRKPASEGLLWSVLTSDSSTADITAGISFCLQFEEKCGLKVRQSACHTFAPVSQMCRPICSDTPRGEQRHCATPVTENTACCPHWFHYYTLCMCVCESVWEKGTYWLRIMSFAVLSPLQSHYAQICPIHQSNSFVHLGIWALFDDVVGVF